MISRSATAHQRLAWKRVILVYRRLFIESIPYSSSIALSQTSIPHSLCEHATVTQRLPLAPSDLGITIEQPLAQNPILPRRRHRGAHIPCKLFRARRRFHRLCPKVSSLVSSQRFCLSRSPHPADQLGVQQAPKVTTPRRESRDVLVAFDRLLWVVQMYTYPVEKSVE